MGSCNPESWIAEFTNTHGRAPRILHIGNIANNAYNNAVILNRAGLENDVICYDYYHIMGCPEWEDADFRGDWGDDFYPEWSRIDLNGFRRPVWFVQGPFLLCVQYLLARRKGQARRSAFWWQLLKLIWYNKTLLLFLRRRKKLILRLRDLYIDFMRWREKQAGQPGSYHPEEMAAPDAEAGTHACRRPESFQERAECLITRFAEQFPQRRDRLSYGDLYTYRRTVQSLQKIAGFYDLIIGYSTDGAYPLLARKRPYIAFEHGTLRDIPDAANKLGRIACLVYRNADHVLVTNTDCIDNAKRLAGNAVTHINHPYDEDHALKVSGHRQERKRLQERLAADCLFFFPTRQDWVVGTGYADKRNQVFLNAFIQMRKTGHSVGLVACQWGANVDASKDLLTESRVDRHVLWVPPMGTIQFERTARACHITVDQFKLGSFGGVLFKAMAAGAPCLTYLDEMTMLQTYGELLPVINCETTQDIITAMVPIFQRPEMLAEIGQNSRLWIKRHYNSSETVRLQVAAFHQCISMEQRL